MPDNNALPETIGRYEVKRLLGSGAMGSVYLAEDPRIKRKLAVKVVKLDTIRNEAERKEYLARFQREAEVSGVLNHPGIVTIYDVGDSDLGPFLAMEFVGGQPLDHLVKSGETISLKAKLHITAGIAEALDHAHCHGIVHRDVKPGNVMISEDGRPKLMDFGIAKREDAHLTQTGTFLGTPSYASPEQIKEGHVTERSDIFSFGVMIFELLSGHLPFPGSSINTILYRIVNEPPLDLKPPVLGLLPDGWRKVFGKVLAKDPANRYPTCSAFVRELVESTTDMSQSERVELLGTLRATKLASGAPPVVNQSHEPTLVVSTEATAKRNKSKASLWVGAGVVLALAIGGYFLFFRKVGGETVQLSSVPAEAQVTVDGQDMGITPRTLPLKPGQKVVLEHKGFLPKDVIYTAGKTVLKLELQPIICEVTIQTNPPGASIVMDEQKLSGETPLPYKQWNQGQKHKLTFTKGDQVASIDFEVGETPDKIYPLKPADAPAIAATQGTDPSAPGAIKNGAEYAIRVKEGGKDKGEIPSGGKLVLPPGQHKLELANPIYFFKDVRTLNVQAGTTATLNLPGLALLTVGSSPYYDAVVVDGTVTTVESNGETPIKMVKGNHVIGIRGTGVRQSVDLKGDQALNLTKVTR